VQLASYRSQAEAQSEYQRLKARHGGLLGDLPPSIQKAELGAAGTYYRLGVGPLSTKQSASNLCNSLIAAGEKDCLVRRQ
jgi:cell division protein FtsN